MRQEVSLGGVAYTVFDKADNPVTSYQATAYQRKDTGEIVIANRGTEFDREALQDGALTDGGMVLAGVNAQMPDAMAFTKKVLDNAKMDAEANKHPLNVTVTGHSLGGTLAEATAYKYGLHGETFNSYGAAGLLGSAPIGGNQVIDHVRATDVVSAASAHFGEVRTYAAYSTRNRPPLTMQTRHRECSQTRHPKWPEKRYQDEAGSPTIALPGRTGRASDGARTADRCTCSFAEGPTSCEGQKSIQGARFCRDRADHRLNPFSTTGIDTSMQSRDVNRRDVRSSVLRCFDGHPKK